jgi:hypothetical protein
VAENLPAVQQALEEYGTGLEDISADEVAIPRITINHADGVFKDRLTGEEFPEMHGILLGMIKQRVMWHPEISENSDSRPQCKSSDAQTGYPNLEGPRLEDKFPWQDAPGLDLNSLPKDEHGRVVIACATCPFAKWGEKKPGKTTSEPPRCSERHTYPIMYTTQPGLPIDRAGIFSVQRSGIKDSKTFLAGFVQTKMPLFSAYVTIALLRKKRGMVNYAIATFKKTGPVPQEDWADYAKELAGIREFLRQSPRFDGEEEDPGGDTVTGQATRMPANQAPAPATTLQGTVVTPTLATPTVPPTAPVAPAAQAAPASVIDAASEVIPAAPDDEELPF